MSPFLKRVSLLIIGIAVSTSACLATAEEQIKILDPATGEIDGKTALYVVGGKRHGSMGPTIGSFAQEADAKRFAAEYGGKVLRFAEITPAMVDLSGGALHDTRM